MMQSVGRRMSSILHHFTIARPATSNRKFHRISLMADTCGDAGEMPSDQSLPKLSASDFKQYNRMAELMDMFVSY